MSNTRSDGPKPAAKRTTNKDIPSVGEKLSDAEMRLVSGGADGPTCTSDNRTCDQDATRTHTGALLWYDGFALS